ncbi:MAG: sigma-70 family RNA polymerase sigma factor [Bacillota bacterium]|nr:sigma-70 family RNA polymerase sigma factor [Bacillota bacterium]
MQKLMQEMVETYGDRIYRLAMRYTRDSYMAQDLTQETFLRAYKHLNRFDRSKPAGPWLFKIANNLCRNWLRDNRELPVEMVDDLQAPEEESPEKYVLEREGEDELIKALYSLPQMYREVLLLKHVGELSYAEIGETLELEPSLVKNRLYRGRMMLKEALEKGRG